MPSPPVNVEAIGKYRVTGAADDINGLGDQVFFAVDPDTPASERQFRIKLLDVRGLDRAKALRELRLVRRLKHEAIAPVVEYFEHGSKLAVVIETLDGLWLDQLLEHVERQGVQLPPQAIWRIGLGIAGALAAAHLLTDEQGRVLHISHGRLGPDQIRLSWQGQVRVYGVGLRSVFADRKRSERAQAFAAPEHHRKGMPGGSRVDVYGVGAILWTLLTGEQPAPGERLAKLVGQRDDVPDSLASGIDLALERSAAARKISCQQLEERLAKALDGGDDPDELRTAVAAFRDEPLAVAADSPLASESSGAGDELDLLPVIKSGRDSDHGDDGFDGQDEGLPVTLPRPRSSSPADAAEKDVGSSPPAKPRRGAEGGGMAAPPDVHEQVTIPAEGSDPPEDDKPGPSKLPRPGDDSVVERISSLFDDVEIVPEPGSGAGKPESKASEPQQAAPKVPPAGPSDEVPTGPADSGADNEGGAKLASSGTGDEAAQLRAKDSTPTPADRLSEPTDEALVGERDEPVAAVAKGSEPAKGRGVSPLMAVLLALVVGAAGFAAAWLLKPGGATSSSPVPTAPTAHRSTTASSGSAPAPPSAAPATAIDAGPADAAAAEAAPDAGVEAPADPEGDGSELLSYEGYLTVKSRVTAEVYVQGIHLGVTNRKVKSRCRQRFIRLRDPASGKWLTAGNAVRIACMSSTTVTIDPPGP